MKKKLFQSLGASVYFSEGSDIEVINSSVSVSFKDKTGKKHALPVTVYEINGDSPEDLLHSVLLNAACPVIHTEKTCDIEQVIQKLTESLKSVKESIHGA